MRYFLRWQWLILFAIAVGGAFGAAGCLQAEDAVLARYDDAKDEFIFLNLYQRLRGENEADRAYLQQLWRNRDHIITLPIPDILQKAAILRLGPKSFASFSIASAPEKLDPIESPVPLDTIRVMSGKFFQRDGMLCYFDQVAVPGKTIDSLLDVFKRPLCAELDKAISQEMARRQGGGERQTWKALRVQLIRTLTKSKDAKNDEAEITFFQVIDPESLEMIQKAAKDGSLPVRRDKSLFSWSIPMTDADAAEVVTTIDRLRTNVADAPDLDPAITPAVMGMLDALKVNAGEKRVDASLDLKVAFTHLRAVQKVDEPLPDDPDHSADDLTMGTLIRAQIPIDQQLQLKDVLADFEKGELKAFPPDKSVEPGAGLMKATEPATPTTGPITR